MWELSLLQACLEEEDCVIIHVYLQDIIQMKRVGKSQGWSRLSQEWIKLINSQSVEDVPRGIKWSHGMVSIVHCALCTNPWSMWEFYVGLGTCSWACVKRKISLNPWRGWHQVVIVIKIAVCKFKWSITKRSSAWILPSFVVSMVLWRCVTPRVRCTMCLPVIRRRCHVICLRVAFCHVIVCISSACFPKHGSVRVLPVLSVVRFEPNHTRTRPRYLRNIIL